VESAARAGRDGSGTSANGWASPAPAAAARPRLDRETPRFAFADDTELNGRLVSGKLPPGSVVAAGRNFGCGSSREQAVSCLKGHELTIVAKGFARIFLQNGINLGLRVAVVPELEAATGDDVEIGSGRVSNRTTGRSFAITPLPSARQAIVEAGGLIAYTRQRLEQGQP